MKEDNYWSALSRFFILRRKKKTHNGKINQFYKVEKKKKKAKQSPNNRNFQVILLDFRFGAKDKAWTDFVLPVVIFLHMCRSSTAAWKTPLITWVCLFSPPSQNRVSSALLPIRIFWRALKKYIEIPSSHSQTFRFSRASMGSWNLCFSKVLQFVLMCDQEWKPLLSTLPMLL